MRTEPKTNGHSRQTVGIDELTGVWNRAGFAAAASPVFRSCQRREAPVALAYFDFYSGDSTISLTLDPTIDRVLMAMGELMRKAFRASDVVGRIEALRFAVLLPDCTDEALAAVAGVRALTDGSTSRLALAAGMVRNTVGGTFDDLMFAADMRTKQIKREQLGA
jgi:GGDEF domain-containing protein